MPSLKDLRAQIPELSGLDDDAAVAVIHQAYYPDLELSAVASALGHKAKEPKAEPSGKARRLLGDTGLSLLKGVIGVPEAALGLADLVTGGAAGRMAQAAGFRPAEAKAILDEYLSPEQQAANREVQRAEGFMGKMGAALANPSVIAQTVLESLPAMGAGGVVARGVTSAALRASPALAGRVAAAEAAPLVASPQAQIAAARLPVYAGAAGEGVVGAGMSAEQIRQETPGGELSAGQSALAAGSGALTGVLGVLGGRLSQRLGIGDIDTMLAQASRATGAQRLAAEEVKKGVTRRVLEGIVSEGVLEELPQSLQEQIAQNLATGKPIEDGLDHAAVLGLLSGGLMGGVAGGLGHSGKAAADKLRAEGLQEERGPNTRALNAVVETAAQKVESGEPLPPEPGTAPAAGAMATADPTATGSAAEGMGAPPAIDFERVMSLMHEQAYDDLQATLVWEARKDLPRTPGEVIGQEPDALAMMQSTADAERRADQRPDPNDIREAIDETERRNAATRALYATILPTDILNPKGEPFRNERAANTVAKREGGSVVVVEGGWAVRPKETNAPATGGTAGSASPDAGRGDGTGVLRDGRPADVPAGAAPAAGEGAERPGAVALRPDGPGEPAAPALTLREQWQAAVARGDKEAARAINEQIVAEKKGNAPVQPAAPEAKPVQAPAPAAPAAPAAAAGAAASPVEAAGVTQGGPGSDAGNGFKHGPKKGERYRVGAVAVAGGALVLEKRLPAGTSATFYLGKDGNFIDSDNVNFIGSGLENLWIPESKEAADRATAILDELGRLELTDPKRKEAKERLKALVTSTASGAVEAAGVKGKVASDATPKPAKQPTKPNPAWDAMPAADRLDVLKRAGWTEGSKSTQRMQSLNWDKMTDGQRQRVGAAMATALAAPPSATPTTTEGARDGQEVQAQEALTPQPTAEPSTATTVAESTSPRDRDSGDAGVATGQGGSGPAPRVTPLDAIKQAPQEPEWSVGDRAAYRVILGGSKDPWVEGKVMRVWRDVHGGEHIELDTGHKVDVAQAGERLIHSAPEADKPAPQPSANTIFTEDAATAARARLKAKLGRLNSGIDPEMLMDGITLAGYHIEKGARTFAAYAKAMVDDLGDAVKPYLQSWYMAVRGDPRATQFKAEMDKASAVEDLTAEEIDALAKPPAAAEQPDSGTPTVPEQAQNAATEANDADAVPTQRLPDADPAQDRPIAPAGDGDRQPLDAGLAGQGAGAAEVGGVLPGAGGAGEGRAGGAGQREALRKAGFGDTLDELLSMRGGVQEAPSASLSRSTTTGPRIDLASAQALSEKLAADGLLKLNVVQSSSDLPPRLRAQLSKSAPDGRVRGAYFRSTDQVWMVADHIRGADEFVEVALHEAFHRGLGRLIPEAKPVLREIWRTNQSVRKATAEQMRTHGIGQDEAIEEALAKMAEAGTVRDLKGWPKLLEAIRSWLGKVARAVGIEMTWADDMVADLVAAATREGLRGGVHVSEAEADLVAAKRAPTVTVDTDEATGAPVYATDDITIGFPQETERFEYVLNPGEKLVNYSIGPADGFDSYGFVELVIGADGVPKALADIEIKPELRGQAIGEKVMEALLGAHPGVDIEISNIVEGARGFWSKMGVPEQNRAAGEAYDGTLNYETFRQAQDDRGANRAAAGRGEAGQGRDATAEGGARGAGKEAQGLMLSRADPADMRAAPVLQQIQQRANDLLTTQRTFNWWHRTVGTQFHKAKVDSDFGRVFNAAQDYLHDTSAFANDPADLAPDLLPQLKHLGDLKKSLTLKKDDREKLAAAVFEGTLNFTRDDSGTAVEAGPDDTPGVVWTPTELRERFGFNDQQVKLYEQTRAAIDRSLDTLVASDVARLFGDAMPAPVRALVSGGDLGRFRGIVTALTTQKLEAAQAELADVRKRQRTEMSAFWKKQKAALEGPQGRAGTRHATITDLEQEKAELQSKHARDLADAEAEAAKWADLQRTVAGKYQRIGELKARGYAPLQRFGRYTLDVVGEDGTRKFFGLYESEAEANAAARAFREAAEPGDKVSQGVLSEEAYKQFSGMTPETLELFAEVAGVEKNEVFQEYLRRAKNNRSALKRLIHRKGVAGYSEDTSRVLAQFIVSNARAASTNLHVGEIGKAIQDIPKEKGDVIDEAIRLREYVQTPQEEAQAIRALLFTQYLGGSVASAMVNLTQPLMMTLPYLSQFGGVAAAVRHLTGAVKAALGSYDRGSELGKALALAEKEGIVSPQELHQLQAEASGTLARNPGLRRALFAWGSLFSAAEQFNRRLSFIAAFNSAKERGMDDPAGFAARAVEETQGIYNKGNKPRWARGAVGGTLFTFKQYSVSYMEFLKRLPTRERTLALAVLLLAAGAQGMPGADDLDDIIDTIGQGLGYDTNAKLWKTRVLSDAIGDDGADFVLRGFSALPGFPLDVAGRLGLGNLIPGTGLLLKSKTDKAGEVAEALGPVASTATGAAKAIQAAAGGNVSGVIDGIAPKGIKDLAKALEMYQTGEYRDSKGRKVTAADTTDALVKSLGFQPAPVARDSRRVQMAQQQIALARVTETEIADAIARARVDGKPEDEQAARQRLARWNEVNPESRIVVTPMQIIQRVRQLRTTRDERFVRAAPREMRQAVTGIVQ